MAAIAPNAADTFVEVGPGRGVLTRALASTVARLICVEIDRDLASRLSASLPSHVEIVTADFLEVDVRALLGTIDGPARVAGNLPYNVASPIVFRLFAAAEEGRVLKDATIMLQKEVAERLTAEPGGAAYGPMAIQAGRLADAHLLFTLPPGAFRPPPKVTSAVVQLRFRPSPVDVGDAQVFERVVRGAFLQRRKTLANALAPVAHALGRNVADLLARAGVDGGQRPERKAPIDQTVASTCAVSRASVLD